MQRQGHDTNAAPREYSLVNRDQYELMARMEEQHWYFIGKRALIAMALPPTGRLLDIGAGTGGNVRLLLRRPGLRPVGMEYDEVAIRLARERGSGVLVRASADALPFRDGCMDGFLALDVLEHLDAPEVALCEAWRVTRPGGEGIVTVPAFAFLWSSHDEVLHHRRRYTFSMLESQLPEGLKVVHKSGYNILLFPIAVAWRLLKRICPIPVRGDDFVTLPSWLNKLVARLFSWEALLVSRLFVPFGVGLFFRLRRL